MRDAETYHKFAQECRRMAQTASANDRAVLLQIAEAWEEQAKHAHRSTERKGDGQAGDSLIPDGQ